MVFYGVSRLLLSVANMLIALNPYSHDVEAKGKAFVTANLAGIIGLVTAIGGAIWRWWL